MKNIFLHSINAETFFKISAILNNDIEKQFVYFYDSKNTLGVFFNNQLVGLFTLNKFIGNTLAIHIALLPEYRCKGIGSTSINTIVNELGQIYPNIEYFIANTSFDNKKAINSLEKAGWERTYEYDEEMEREGSEFFIIYQRKNPHYSKKIMEYKI